MFAAWLLLAIIPHDWVVTDNVDVLEINVFYDQCGKVVFRQLIAWDFDGVELRVRAWRMAKTPSFDPRWDWERNDAFSIWNEDGIIREVRAKAMRESHTQIDPELDDRDYLPKERRRELRKP